MQTKKLFISIVSFLLYAPLIFSSPVPDPEAIVEEVHKYESFFHISPQPTFYMKPNFSFTLFLFTSPTSNSNLIKAQTLQNLSAFLSKKCNKVSTFLASSLFSGALTHRSQHGGS